MRGRSGSSSSGEEATRVRLGKNIYFGVVWLTLLTVALVVGAKWETIRYSVGTSAGSVFHGKQGDGIKPAPPRDPTLGGLLSHVDGKSCRSKREAVEYRRVSPYKPSPLLQQKLRDYEARHRRCGPGTEPYKHAAKLLGPEGPIATSAETECKYVLWTPFLGLGNRIISLASAFLYALLTDRVLLIDRRYDFADLFCEPIPYTSWVIPSDFPLKKFDFNEGDPLSYGSLIKNNGIPKNLPAFVYAHIVHKAPEEENRFFYEDDQRALKQVPWLFLRSEAYFAPAFFLNSDFEPELSRMFPETDTVFHHLSRYLFHPTNKIWGIITRYYHTYLSGGKDNLGIQIRIFDHPNSPFDVVSKQIINCTLKNDLLPKINPRDPPVEPKAWKIKSVLIVTLHYGYLDRLRTLYWEHPAEEETLISVHQPSQEEWQRTDEENHDIKAWMEMNLLSFSDVLMTSAVSTFGYTAQALGGLRPWILTTRERPEVPEPACYREISMEPCFHLPPQDIVEKKMEGRKGKVAPYVGYCLDFADGIKIFGRNTVHDNGR